MYKTTEPSAFDTYVQDKIKSDDYKQFFNELNFRFTEKEVNKAISMLKNKKSPGRDSILYEFIKYGKEVLAPYITKLFNSVYTSGIFPKVWAESILTIVHKSGPYDDPSNYRGICLTAALGKLFCSVLNIFNFVHMLKLLIIPIFNLINL